MGSELVSDSLAPVDGDGKNVISVSYIDIFEKHLPYYLSIGMTWDQYWNQDCTMVKYYRQADRLRQEREDSLAWLHGMYIYEAIGDMSPLLRFTMDDKPKKPTPYTKQPYMMRAKENSVKDKREQEFTDSKNRMLAFMKMHNAKGGDTNG